MRTSNKSRSRNKNNNRRQNPGNVINRVFDSSGPEGRVRGTPQQIIDKYQSLASDAMLAGDRIAHENFLQHSEHYSRLLVVAQKKQHENRSQNNSNANDETQLNSSIGDEVVISEVLENDQAEIKTNELEPKNKRRPVKKKIEIVHEERPKTLDEGNVET
jgi:hypothetical protein